MLIRLAVAKSEHSDIQQKSDIQFRQAQTGAKWHGYIDGAWLRKKQPRY